MTTNPRQEIPLSDEVKERLILIDQYGAAAARAHFAGRAHEAATQRVLLNVNSDLIGDLLR